MSATLSEERIELDLNIYLELRSPKEKDILDKVDNAKEISVFVDNVDYSQDKVLTIFNYGTHIRVVEHYKSRIGEINVGRSFNGIKPSTILKLLFPNTFK